MLDFFGFVDKVVDYDVIIVIMNIVQIGIKGVLDNLNFNDFSFYRIYLLQCFCLFYVQSQF